MPQSLVQVYVHIVFSTKERRPFLQDKEFEIGHTRIWRNLPQPRITIVEGRWS